MSKLTVKARSMQIGTRSSPAGFDVVDEHGEPYAWSWKEETARLIAAAPDLLDSLDWIVTFASEHPEWFGDGKPEEGAEFEWLASARALLAAVRGQP